MDVRIPGKVQCANGDEENSYKDDDEEVTDGVVRATAA